MTNHEGIYAFSLRKGSDAMSRAPFNRAIISALLFFSTAAAPSLLSQSLSKEYLRLGGRVVAVESFSFSVTPDPLPSVLGAGSQEAFTASRAANWSVTSGGTIAPGAGLSTTLTVANPIPNGLLSLTVTATEQGGSGSKSIIVPLMTPVSISGAVTTLNPGGQAQYSANIPVTWELSPTSAGTVSPASTAANTLTVVTIFNNPPGSPAVVTLTARDARAATDSRFQNNTATRNIGIQYPGPPSATGGYAATYYNGSGAAGWTFVFSDPQGPQNIAWMAVHFSGTTAQSIPYSCAFYVFPSYGGFSYLLNDANTGAVTGNIGDDTPLRNSQCLIEMKGLRYYDQGGLRYLYVPTYLNPSFLGAKDIWLSVGNNQGQQQPAWLKVASFFTMYYNYPASSLALHPSQGVSVTQQFRTSAMSTYSGGEIPLMSMSAKDLSNGNSCQLSMFPTSNWAYVYTNNPYGYDGSSLTNTSYVMNTSRCSVAMSSLKFTSYTQAAPAAPYAFMDAAIQANTPIRGTTQNMFGAMYYVIGNAWYGNPDLYIGFWTIPGSL